MQKNLSLIYCLTEMIYSFWFLVASLRFCNTIQQFKPKTLKITVRAILSRLSWKYSFHCLSELIPKKGISGDHHTHHPEPKYFYIITGSIDILPNFFRIAIISLYNSLWRVRRVFPIRNKRTLLYDLSSLLFIPFLKTSSRGGSLIVLISIRSVICMRLQVRNYNWVIDIPWKKGTLSCISHKC